MVLASPDNLFCTHPEGSITMQICADPPLPAALSCQVHLEDSYQALRGSNLCLQGHPSSLSTSLQKWPLSPDTYQYSVPTLSPVPFTPL